MRILLICVSLAYFSVVASAQNTHSEFIKIADDNWHFETDHSATFFTPFGTNYYDPESFGSSEVWDNLNFVAPHVIGKFDSIRTRSHFAQLQELGVNVIRIFLSVIKFEPTLFQLNDTSFQKVDKIIDLAKEYNLRIIFDLVEVWEGAPESSWLSWDYYSDEVSILGLEYLVRAFGNRYKDEPAIFAWDLTNEPVVKWSDGPMDLLWIDWVHNKYLSEDSLNTVWLDYPLSGEAWNNIHVPEEFINNPYDQRLFDFQLFREDVAYNWTQHLVQALREVDQNHLITIGLIQWSVPLKKNLENPGGYAAFNPRKLAPLLDYVSMHGYNWWDEHEGTYIQGLLRYSFADKPVLLEEFEYKNSTVDATLGSASGWLSWAAYQGIFDPDPKAFLFDADGKITASGEAFQSKASLIKNSIPERQTDADLLDADLRFLLTDGPSADSLYYWYVQFQQGLSGPAGFTILNLFPPVLSTVVGVTAPELPRDFELGENYPNPFNFETTIQYQILKEAEVTLEIYNTLGQKIITLVKEKLPPGTYSAQWNGKDFAGRNVSDGMYLYRLQVGNFVKTNELILLR